MNVKEESAKTYKNFDAAEADMRKSLPNVLYKYRDWGNLFHCTTLTIPEVYFSHPKSLNDPYDIRIPVQIDYEEIYSSTFRSRLEDAVQYRHPELVVGSYDFKTVCDNLFELIKSNPIDWFEKNMRAIRESDLYDSIGVLSLTPDVLSENMWAYYGNNNKGFCVGYDGVEIFKAHKCSCTRVQYRDEPIKYDFSNSKSTDLFTEFFTKGKKWEHEQEYRFVTMFMKNDSDRKIAVSEKAIIEVVLGSQISPDHEKAIVEVLREKYRSKISLFKIENSVSSYGFKKVEVKY